MKQFLLSLLLITMLAMTVGMAAATTNSHLYWLDDETNNIFTITDGDIASFSWKSHTGYYDLQVDLGLYDNNVEIADYSIPCTSSTTCNGEGILTQSHYGGPGIYTLHLDSIDALSKYYDTESYDEIFLIVEKCEPEDKLFTGINVTRNPSSGDAPLSVQLNCSAIGGDLPISYSWTLGDGYTTTTQNPVHVYDNVGIYTATCTAFDADDDVISGSVIINAQEPQPENLPPEMEHVPDQFVLERDSFVYDLQVSDPDNTRDELTCYDAEFYKVVDGNTAQLKSLTDWLILEDCTLSGIAPDVDNDEKYFVRVGVRDPEELFDEEEFYLYVLADNRPPTIAPVDDMTIPEGTVINYAFSVSDPDNDALVCSVAPGYTLPVWLTLHNCALSGVAPQVMHDSTESIGIRVIDTHGAYDQEAFTITITDDSQAPTALFTWTPNSPYAKDTVAFTDASTDDGTIVSYAWSFGDGMTSTTRHPTHVYQTPGDYIISLTVTDNEGLTGIEQRTITVDDRKPENIIVTPNPPNGYAPLTVAFTCTVTGGDVPFTYRWDFDDGLFSSLQNPTHIYDSFGSYTPECIATDADGDTIRGLTTVIVEEPDQPNHKPIMQPIADHEIDEQTNYFLQLEVSDPDGDTPLICFSNDDLGYGIALPDWLTLDRVACTLSGTAPAVDMDKVYYVEVGVQDPKGLADVEYYYLRVNNLVAPNQPPVADFAWTPSNPETGEVVTFTSYSYDTDGTLVLYEWDLDGDGNYESSSSSTVQTSRSYAVAGNYDITLRVTDNDGASDFATKQLVVGPADINFSDIIVTGVPPTGYVSHDVSFICTAVGGNSPISYYWTFGDGASSNVQHPTHTYTNVGTYTATCTATDVDGDTISDDELITVLSIPPINQPPVASFSWTPNEPFENELVSFTDQSYDQDGTIVSYYWSFGDGAFSTLRHPTHTYGVRGQYTVSLTVTDDDGWPDTEQHVVTVKRKNHNITDIIVTGIPPIGYAPHSVSFMCTAIGGDAPISYAWNFGDGYTSTTQNPTHVYTINDTYTATCTATDVDGDSLSGDAIIAVLNVPPVKQPPVASFSWTPDEPYKNEQVSFTDQSYDQDGFIVSYYWTFGDGTSSTVRHPTHVYSMSGSYTVSLTVTDNDGLPDTEQHVVMVKCKDHNITDINVTANPQTGQEPLDVDFTCTAIGGDAPISYYWTFGDGAASNQQNPAHIYAVNGTYTAFCTATDIDGDSRTGSITITVNEKDHPIIIDEFGCNPDVVRGHEEYCAIHVVDEYGNDMAGVDVTFTYIDPSFVNGVNFGSCVTNFKGHCKDDPIVNYEAGNYTVEATANLLGYLPPTPLNDTFLVWEKRYDIIGLEVFEDDSFTIPQDTFYRGEDMYASFAIYDLMEDKFTCDDELVNEMFLRVHNAQPLQLYEVTDAGWLAIIQQDLLDWFRGLFGNEVQCTYQYWLPSIPLSDDYLGDGKVFAFTFNFSDSTAGQASKEVTVLNNPVSLDLLDTYTITKHVASDSESITIDLKDYVSDVETLPVDMIYTLTSPDVMPGSAVGITNLGNGVYMITAGPNRVTDITIAATADDTDGSIATNTSLIDVIIQFVPLPPVAIAGPDQSVIEHTTIFVDGGASYDPDGGNIVAYYWSFDNGDIATGATASTTYTMPGAYTVTLTVTDDEGEQDTDTLDVIVGKTPYVPQCSDGKDNDNDGKIDMDDPNCDSPSDNSEYGPVSTGAERGLNILSISTYSFWGYEQIVSGDFVTVEVVMENEAGEDLEDLRVGFSIPYLGVKQKSHQFSIDDGERETIIMDVYIPYDAELGEYYTEITVANTDLRRSTHRMITVVEE